MCRACTRSPPDLQSRRRRSAAWASASESSTRLCAGGRGGGVTLGNRDGSGSLSTSEFLAIPDLQQNPLVERVLAIFDEDHNGEIDFDGGHGGVCWRAGHAWQSSSRALRCSA